MADAAAPRAQCFAWSEMPVQHPRPGVSQRGFRGQGILVTQNLVQPGTSTFPHSHPFEQLVLVTRGSMRLHVGEQLLVLRADAIAWVPPGVVHWAEPPGADEEPFVSFDIFAPVREDFLHLTAYQPPLR
jgi:quercetin dioxygenase-like cupin family protein